MDNVEAQRKSMMKNLMKTENKAYALFNLLIAHASNYLVITNPTKLSKLIYSSVKETEDDLDTLTEYGLIAITKLSSNKFRIQLNEKYISAFAKANTGISF